MCINSLLRWAPWKSSSEDITAEHASVFGVETSPAKGALTCIVYGDEGLKSLVGNYAFD